MIKVNGHLIKPTIFPDGTSQVWNLPDKILNTKVLQIDWRFEAEREIIDLYSLRKLLRKDAAIHLHVPFLPYGRQDKGVSNDSTFNLRVFADLINGLEFAEVTSVDVHNPSLTRDLIRNFRNEEMYFIHHATVTLLSPHFIVFPDYGARKRYLPITSREGRYCGIPTMTFEKVREQSNGNITGHRMVDGESYECKPNTRFLILDDLCDGGATFLSVAKTLNQKYENSHTINLFVTHGIFSKGREVLEKAGIKLFTTNSLCKNTDGIEV
jgi:ribose-phosphate pyrophosphokinase